MKSSDAYGYRTTSATPSDWERGYRRAMAEFAASTAGTKTASIDAVPKASTRAYVDPVVVDDVSDAIDGLVSLLQDMDAEGPRPIPLPHWMADDPIAIDQAVEDGQAEHDARRRDILSQIEELKQLRAERSKQAKRERVRSQLAMRQWALAYKQAAAG